MEQKKRKIYVVGYSKEYSNWMQGENTSLMKDADLVVFTGGDDVTPALYKEKQHYTTHNNLRRDKEELEEFRKAKELNIPCIGICRGSQLLCCLAGGKLVQDQKNPYYTHDIELYDGKTIAMTSTHHQAQYPYELPPERYKLIAWANGLSPYHKGGNDEELLQPEGREAEIVYYPKIKALGIQGHPEEFMRTYHSSDKSKESIDYLRGLLNNFLEEKL